MIAKGAKALGDAIGTVMKGISDMVKAVAEAAADITKVVAEVIAEIAGIAGHHRRGAGRHLALGHRGDHRAHLADRRGLCHGWISAAGRRRRHGFPVPDHGAGPVESGRHQHRARQHINRQDWSRHGGRLAQADEDVAHGEDPGHHTKQPGVLPGLAAEDPGTSSSAAGAAPAVDRLPHHGQRGVAAGRPTKKATPTSAGPTSCPQTSVPQTVAGAPPQPKQPAVATAAGAAGGAHRPWGPTARRPRPGRPGHPGARPASSPPLPPRPPPPAGAAGGSASGTRLSARCAAWWCWPSSSGARSACAARRRRRRRRARRRRPRSPPGPAPAPGGRRGRAKAATRASRGTVAFSGPAPGAGRCQPARDATITSDCPGHRGLPRHRRGHALRAARQRPRRAQPGSAVSAALAGTLDEVADRVEAWADWSTRARRGASTARSGGGRPLRSLDVGQQHLRHRFVARAAGRRRSHAPGERPRALLCGQHALPHLLRSRGGIVSMAPPVRHPAAGWRRTPPTP